MRKLHELHARDDREGAYLAALLSSRIDGHQPEQSPIRRGRASGSEDEITPERTQIPSHMYG